VAGDDRRRMGRTMTAFVLGMVGTGAGLYYGRRLAGD
jgi:hypothetical protein